VVACVVVVDMELVNVLLVLLVRNILVGHTLQGPRAVIQMDVPLYNISPLLPEHVLNVLFQRTVQPGRVQVQQLFVQSVPPDLLWILLAMLVTQPPLLLNVVVLLCRTTKLVTVHITANVASVWLLQLPLLVPSRNAS